MIYGKKLFPKQISPAAAALLSKSTFESINYQNQTLNISFEHIEFIKIFRVKSKLNTKE